MSRLIARVLLVAMILLGLWGAGKLSFEQHQTGEACPVLGDTVPACYIAFGGYILIALGAALSFAPAAVDKISAIQSWGGKSFWIGMVVAGGLAALASVLELVKGDVCPVAFGSVPMCYVSLAFSIVIIVMFIMSFRRAV